MSVQKKKMRVIADPHLKDTYADKFVGAMFDGKAMAVMLGVTGPEPVGADTRTVQLVSRLVLSPPAAIELVNTLNKLLASAAINAPASTKQ